MNGLFHIALISLFVSCYRKSFIVAGCQVCIRQFVATPPALVSITVSSSPIEIPGNFLASSTEDAHRQRSAGRWFPQVPIDKVKQSHYGRVMLHERDGNNDITPDINFDASAFAANITDSSDSSESPMSLAMISTIGFYKRIISPLLPPACRFVPTCSSYGVQAIQEFGPTKGCVLIAWRILRCSPFGGKGYDPPKWPPVSYTYSSY